MKKKIKKIIMFDLDNTLCSTKGRNYYKAKPRKKIIKIVNELYNNNFYIKIFTSRYMGRNNEDYKLVKKKFYLKTKMQLDKWNLKYNELIMGKPSYDFQFDDKSYNSKSSNFIKLLKKLK
ncbi:phosphoheptose isomerase [Candidatus Pelagibacter sp.]|nr:phosphoheptose isomerase [Candidatus Pelagibacter sp.]